MFALIEAWAQSDQSQKAFCAQQGITYHRFHYWHRRFKDQKEAALPGPAFMPLSVLAHASPSAELIYPDGRRLLLHQGVDAAFLKALLN